MPVRRTMKCQFLQIAPNSIKSATFIERLLGLHFRYLFMFFPIKMLESKCSMKQSIEEEISKQKCVLKRGSVEARNLTRMTRIYRRMCMSRRGYRNDPKFSDRYAWANSADPDQTAPRSSLIRVYTVCHSVCIVWTHYCMRVWMGFTD